MITKPIDFRQLLERLLPLDELPQIEEFRARRALRAVFSPEIEQTGHLALQQLGPRSNLTPSAAAGRPASTIASRSGPEGMILHPRSNLPAEARGGLDQVRRLLRLDDPMLSSDPRRPDARMELMRQLNEAGRELLGASALRFFPAEENEENSPDLLDPQLTREVRAHPEVLYYCPDASHSGRIAAAALKRGVRSVVLAGVTSARGQTLGMLEVTSRMRDAFQTDDLAMVALLADYWAGVLERAARIEKLVFVDPLTSAYNRSYFDLQLQNEMARAEREQNSMALCIADIDNFKSFNTRFGFESGNQVLIHVAQALRRGVRPFDTVARWGGEEFAVLLTSPVQAQDVVTICERLRSSVERQSVQLEALDRRIYRESVTVSVGVALFPDHTRSATDLWRAANQALLEAKRPPKNQVVFFRPPTPPQD